MSVAISGSTLQDHILHLVFPDGGSVDVLLKGAHVLSWKDASQKERLYLSPTTSYEISKAIRGGIPVIFPQFGPGKLANHGFARISPNWEVFSQTSNENEIAVSFKLSDSAHSRELWDGNKFSLIYEVKLTERGNVLTCTAYIENKNEDANLSLDFCFHTYFKVSNISNVKIHNLQNIKFIDKVENKTEHVQEEEILTISKETDRVYCKTPNVIEIVDENHKMIITKDNLSDAVVWNPWIEKSKAFTDLPDDGYLDFVCVEAGKVEKAFTVNPGSKIVVSQTIRSSL